MRSRAILLPMSTQLVISLLQAKDNLDTAINKIKFNSAYEFSDMPNPSIDDHFKTKIGSLRTLILKIESEAAKQNTTVEEMLNTRYEHCKNLVARYHDFIDKLQIYRTVREELRRYENTIKLVRVSSI
jgi:uncharacterized protein YutE (UPF0331/DUF86 family)